MTDRIERFEEIYNAYSGLILAYAARRTANMTDATDIVAETFTVAWRRMGDVPNGEEARPWLYGVARRVLANHHRGVSRRQRLDERMALTVPTPPADDSDPAELELIGRALAALNEGDRELLTLLGWDGLDREEIAMVLGCSTPTVRVRLHRARRRFERELAAAGMQRSHGDGHESDRWATARPDLEES